MKFIIITHAEHKIHKKEIFAYEPYVREMNLWLKYVDTVKIVAPVSKAAISSIESKYLFNKRNSQLDWESHDLDNEEQIPDQVRDDEINKQIATSLTPRNNETKRHSQLDWESHDLDNDEQIPNQVGNDGIKLIPISSFDITSIKNILNAIFKIPVICYTIYKEMQWADHIHLRCPGNIGLLGSLVQILFPSKPKTVKYAGNWDPKSKQPLSYRFQKWILSNTFLTRHAKVLVYGEWPNQSKNIVPFFTATYSEKEIFERYSEHSEAIFSNEQIPNQVGNDEQEKQAATLLIPLNDETNCHPQLDWGSHDLENDEQIPNQVGNDGKIYFLFVGAFTKGKQPLLSVKAIYQLKKKGYQVQLDVYGEGKERESIANYILDNSLENEVYIHGNASKEIIKEAYQKAHFLVFISKSEGWPKVVAEAMFWGCLPITSNVSCIPYMLANGTRGAIVDESVEEIVSVIEGYLNETKKYIEQVKKAMEWSRQYTLERFEEDIGKLLEPSSSA